MKVEPNVLVTMEYSLETDRGEPIESSEAKGKPLAFVFGGGQMLPGVEKRIEGMQAGDEREFSLPPEEAFGEKDSGPLVELDKTEFPKDAVFKTGETFRANLPGTPTEVVFEIVENRGAAALVRFHHPHEGKGMRCRVKVISVGDPNGSPAAV